MTSQCTIYIVKIFMQRRVMFVTTNTGAYYICKSCGANNCKLWGDINRISYVFKHHIKCARCITKELRRDLESFIHLETQELKQRAIDYFAPAIPDFSAKTETYRWGTSTESSDPWWDNLPTLPQ